LRQESAFYRLLGIQPALTSIADPDFLSNSSHHPGLAGIVEKRSCLIRLRISRKSALGTATSAIWKMMYRECLTTLAPILTSFSRSVRNDHILTDSRSKVKRYSLL
jgi:hypothetical protein